MSFVQLGKITKFLPILAPFICLAGIVLLQSQEYKKSAQKLNQANYLSQEEQQARVIKFQSQTPTLNFDNLLADWSYLNFVQYFGDANARETIGYKLVPDYFATITKIDPHFTQAHLRLSLANSLYAGNPEKSIALMEKILETVDPASEEAALLWTSKGLDELLFLGDKEAAIKSYKIASQWATLDKSDRPDILKIKDLEKALEFTSEIQLKEAQIMAWSSTLVHIIDNQKKREIIDKINRLKAEILVLEQTEIKSSTVNN